MIRPIAFAKDALNNEYKCTVYEVDEDISFEDINAIYIFASYDGVNWFNIPMYRPIYIGKSTELGTRLSEHDKIPCCKKHGYTHILIHPTSAHKLKAVEAALIDYYQPACNIQGVSVEKRANLYTEEARKRCILSS